MSAAEELINKSPFVWMFASDAESSAVAKSTRTEGLYAAGRVNAVELVLLVPSTEKMLTVTIPARLIYRTVPVHPLLKDVVEVHAVSEG